MSNLLDPLPVKPKEEGSFAAVVLQCMVLLTVKGLFHLDFGGGLFLAILNLGRFVPRDVMSCCCCSLVYLCCSLEWFGLWCFSFKRVCDCWHVNISSESLPRMLGV